MWHGQVDPSSNNFLEFNASAGPKVLISLLYGYVEGHMNLEDFSWTDPLIKSFSLNLYKLYKANPKVRK